MKDFFEKYKVQLIIGGSVVVIAAVLILVYVLKFNDKASSAEMKEPAEEETLLAEADDEDDPQPQENQEESGAQIDAGSLNAGNNDYGTSGITYGIDVSKWQGTIDWSKVKASGIEYAMIRVGYRTEGKGTLCEDIYAKYNLQNASKAGVKVGVYFFSTAVSTQEAEEEAAWVTGFIAKYKITYPVVYNCEGFTQADSRMNSLTNSERTNIAMAFLKYVEKKGYTPMLYASSSELSNSAYWDTDKISGKYKIWVAQYLGTAYTTGTKSSYTGEHAMWQYTNKGIVDGISGSVDMNIAYFGYSSEAEPKESGQIEEAAAPTQATTQYNPYKDVNEQVTAKDETNLRTSASTSDNGNVAYKLKNGEVVTRTAIGTNGWSKVVYNGQTLYAISNYLTTSTEPTTKAPETTTAFDPFADKNFTEVNEQVTAKEETNLRTVPNTLGNEPKYTLKKGEYVTRTGIDPNTNWSRVVYNGETLYAVSSMLTID